MTDREEAVWSRGHRAAHVEILRNACNALGYDDPEVKKVAWILEREAVVATLRDICDEYGDNDWTDDLHLCDVINKHLMRELVSEIQGLRDM